MTTVVFVPVTSLLKFGSHVQERYEGVYEAACLKINCQSSVALLVQIITILPMNRGMTHCQELF